jgi:hypothetical protein
VKKAANNQQKRFDNLEYNRKIAYAAAQDKANDQMRAAGRTAWSEEDYGTACDLFAKLMALV